MLMRTIITIDPVLQQEVDKYAEQNYMSRSELVRQAFRWYVKFGNKRMLTSRTKRFLGYEKDIKTKTKKLVDKQ